MFTTLVLPHAEAYVASFHGDEDDTPWIDGIDFGLDDLPQRNSNAWRHMTPVCIRDANGIDRYWRRE